MGMCVVSRRHCILVKRTKNRSRRKLVFGFVSCKSLLKECKSSTVQKQNIWSSSYTNINNSQQSLITSQKPHKNCQHTSGVPQKVAVVSELAIPSLQSPKSVNTTWPCLRKSGILKTEHAQHADTYKCQFCERTQKPKNNVAYLLVNLEECFLVLNPYLKKETNNTLIQNSSHQHKSFRGKDFNSSAESFKFWWNCYLQVSHKMI